MKSRNKFFFYLFLILIVSLCVYFPSFHAPFQLDDFKIIENNPVIRDCSHIDRIWQSDPTRFFVLLSFAANYQIAQFDVFGYHVINFLIHIFTGVLVFFFLSEIFRIALKKNEKETITYTTFAFFATCIFVLHPLQTSAVTYVVQRSTLLAAFFYIAALTLYLYSREKKRIFLYFLSLLSAFLGAFCKPIIITLPVTLIALEFIFLKNEGSYDRKAFKKFSYKLPFKKEGILLLPYFFLWILIPCLLMVYTKNTSLHEISRQTDMISRQTYLCTQFNVLVKYLRLLILPLNQNLDYAYPLSTTIWEFPTILSLGILVAIMIYGWINIRRNKLLAFSIFFFFITLSLESSIFPLADVIFEHRLYLPLLAFVMLIPQLAFFLNKKTLRIVLISVIVFLSFLTFKRNELWGNKIRFLEDVAQKSSHKPRVHVNLGIAYMQEGLYRQAEESYQRALFLDPLHVKAYLGLGALFLRQGDVEKAASSFQTAIALDPYNDEAFNNQGVLLAQKGELETALSYFNYAIELNPFNLQAFNNRARLFEIKGEYSSAIKDYTSALDIDPSFALMYLNRARVYALGNQHEKSLKDLHTAQSLGMP